MKKGKYIAPAVEITQVKLEGMIAASLVIGDTPGNEQLSTDDKWNIWDSNE